MNFLSLRQWIRLHFLHLNICALKNNFSDKLWKTLKIKQRPTTKYNKTVYPAFCYIHGTVILILEPLENSFMVIYVRISLFFQ